MRYPYLNPAYRLEILDGGPCFLVSEDGVEIISGALYAALLPLCAGQHTEDEVIDTLGDAFPLTQCYYALMTLAQRGILLDAPAPAHPPGLGFWQDATWQEKLAAQPVRLVMLDDAPLDPRPWLTSSGLHLSDAAPLRLVVCDDYRHPALEDINAEALQSGQAWMLAKPSGQYVWAGPIFQPGHTGCWACLRQRLRLNYATHERLQMALQGPQIISPPMPHTPASLALAWQMIALELQKWIIHGGGPVGAIQHTDLKTWQVEHHYLTRRPQCTVCGDPHILADQLRGPVTLQPVGPKVANESGYRSQPPEQLLTDYEQHISPITGIVPVLEPASEAAEALHVYMAGANHARVQGLSDAAVEFLRARSMGKGSTPQQSRASALGEAIERYCGALAQYTEFASYAALDERAIHPNACMLYSQAQYETPRAQPIMRRVPQPLDPDAPQYWTPLWSLSEERQRLLPTDYCYYDRIDPQLPRFCYSDSNGCAAGATLPEAILQGFLELIERDAVAIWWYNCIPRPGVDVASFADPHLLRLAAHYQTQFGRETWALDLTHDFGIPVFAALSRRAEADAEGILMGFGCHFDPAIALSRAFNEMNQALSLLLPFEAHTATHLSKLGTGQEFADWYQHVKLAEADYLAPHPHLPATTFSGFDFQATGRDLMADVAQCQTLVEARGLELLVLDQTQPDIGLPVVRVVVPGLRHFWERRAPGRLYDVPVALGWLPEPRQEADLNPLPMLL